MANTTKTTLTTGRYAKLRGFKTPRYVLEACKAGRTDLLPGVTAIAQVEDDRSRTGYIYRLTMDKDWLSAQEQA